MVAAAAASPSPSPSPAPRAAAAAGRPHPTYTKMITQALAELGGASPRAGIAGYILGRGYSGLPARHDDLLSAHLRRLLAEGALLRLHADSPTPTYILAPPEEQVKRGPGRPPRNKAGDATAPAAAAPAVMLGEKRGRGRPRKNPAPAPAQASSSSSLDKPAHTGIAAHSAAPQPANRKRGLSPTASPGNDDDHDSVVTTKRGRQQGPEAFQNGGHEAGAFPIQNGGTGHVSRAAAMSPESGNNNAASSGVKRGRGRPRKEKPPTPAAASRGFKRGCGRPSPSVSAAASYGKGALRKEWLPAGAKRGRGRPRKDQCVGGGGLVEKGAYEVFFRDMMMTQASGTGQGEEEEDLVLSGEKTPQTEEGVAPGDGRDTRAAADAGYVPVSGDAAATSAPVGAVDSDHLGPADDVVSTAGVKRGRGRPRKIKPAAAMSAETGGDDASVVIEPQGGTPRMEESAAGARSPETTRDAAAPTGVKRPRGRPRKNPAAAAMSAENRDAAASTGGVKRGRGRPPKKKPAAAMSAETRDAAASTGGVKRGRGRPRKEKPAAATGVAGVKRGRGRPMNVSSVGTWYAESAAERELFGHMAQEEAPGDREEARAADGAGRVPVSGENATAAPVEAGNGSDFGPASL